MTAAASVQNRELLVVSHRKDVMVQPISRFICVEGQCRRLTAHSGRVGT